MFTGLIREIGTIGAVHPTATGRDLVVKAPVIVAEAQVGDSIAVNGVCLTVVSLQGEQFTCHAGAETLARTTAAGWQVGLRVNLEPALRAGDRLGGHFVQGHVDGVGLCRARRPVGETVTYEFTLAPEQVGYLVEKGSVAVDGISLTVNAVGEDHFAVAIIPHTLGQTTLAEMRPGQSVNVEVDILSKYVRRALGPSAGPQGVTLDLLQRYGFTD
jgi:riboflavin synthase